MSTFTAINNRLKFAAKSTQELFYFSVRMIAALFFRKTYFSEKLEQM